MHPRFLRTVTRRFGALRRRPWSAALAGLTVAVLVAGTVSVLIGDRESRDFVQTRRNARSALADSTPETSEPSTSEPSTSTVAPTTPQTPDSQPAPVPAPTAPPSPWQVSATSGLTNLAPVIITATGIPSETYYVGQCPAGVTPSLDACVLHDVVTVTDGTLTSTVRVFWWMQGGNVDCGSAPGICVVGVMQARGAVTVASFPISFDPARRPTITVTPGESLTDGQTVVVRGVNIGEGSVVVEECVSDSPACIVVQASSGADGTFTAELTVNRLIEWFGRGGPTSSVCGVEGDCVVEVWLTPKGLDSKQILINPGRPVPLRFAPAPLPTTTTVMWPPPAVDN
jgi:hypothetical protein